MRRAARRDAVEPAIIEALKAYGAEVHQISGPGHPDLLVCYRGRWVPMEVKSQGGRLTKRQREIQWPVVRSVEEAVQAMQEPSV